MKIIDLTQTISHRMQVYPGDTPPELVQTHWLNKDLYTNHQLTTGMHTGTHIDGPWHMLDKKILLSDVSPDKFTGKACVIDISDYKVFNDITITKEKASGYEIVLFYTGFGRHFGSDKYTSGYPRIGSNVADMLTELSIKMIGVDALSPDSAPHLTHKILLGQGIFIAENLTNLDLLLKETSFTVVALPLKIEADSAPARVIAISG